MPNSIAARRRAILRLIREEMILRQDQLVARLQKEGFEVTQSTVSRDLTRLGAFKVAQDNGTFRYCVDESQGTARRTAIERELIRVLNAYAQSISSSGNLAVLQVLPGTASTVSEFLDRAEIEGVLATLAGNDTVLVVATEGVRGAALARRFELMSRS